MPNFCFLENTIESENIQTQAFANVFEFASLTAIIRLRRRSLSI